MTRTIFENAVIHPRPGAPTVAALLVEDGRILRAGSAGECREAASGPHSRVDLEGRHVVPGFIDSHVHTVQMATSAAELDLSAVASFDGILDLVAASISQPGARPGDARDAWLLGGGWGAGEWLGSRVPDRTALDRVTGDRPTALHSADLHSYWLNSAAVTRLGLSDAAGRSGVISESTAFAVQHYLESHVQDDFATRLDAVLQRFLAYGVTGIHDFDSVTALDHFRGLETESRLPIRVHKITVVTEIDALIDAGITSGAGTNMLRYGGVKVFADGSLSSHTGLMSEPYQGDPENRGVASTTPEELTRIVAKCEDHGLSVAIHAIGDDAVHHAVEVLTRSQRSAALPHRIEHFQHARHDDLRRFASRGGVACMQPSSCVTDYPIVDQLLGHRDLVSYGWRSFIGAGGTVAFSSDAPVEGINPFAGIHAAITRQRMDGMPVGGWQPYERLTVNQAFECYTTAAATASGESGSRGALVAGQWADFAVLDRNPFDLDPAGLAETRVETTIVNGNIAWASGPVRQLSE